jgi:glycosyltransferase involved in cell wall biosynthesis
MRVFIGPLEISGIGQHLVHGLRQCGASADLVCDQSHPFAYEGAGFDAWPATWWQRLARWRSRLTRRQPTRKAAAVVLHALTCWFVLAWALPRYDAFVFLYGRTITNTTLELRILRLLNKCVVVVFVGSDARPCYIDGSVFPGDRPFDAAAAAAAALAQRRRVCRLERHAVLVVSARTSAQFLTRPFVNWFALGIPRPPQVVEPPALQGAVRVLHSPSHPVLKGTAEVQAAVERLRARGLAVELLTIEGRPNAEVMQALRDCDLVVDQLYSDTPMAAFATEAASVGRPVLVGGCAADQAAAQVTPLPLPPTLYVRPQVLEATLEALVRDAGLRQRLGSEGAAFVAAHWSPAQVAARLLRMLRGDIPPAWWCTPGELNHVVGCGLPESLARQRVAAVIARGGVGALQVADKPDLERAFVAFAGAAAP